MVTPAVAMIMAITSTTATMLTTALPPLAKTHATARTDPMRARDCVKGDGLG